MKNFHFMSGQIAFAAAMAACSTMACAQLMPSSGHYEACAPGGSIPNSWTCSLNSNSPENLCVYSCTYNGGTDVLEISDNRTWVDGVVDVVKPISPPPPKGDTCSGNPIYPLRGVKKEAVSTEFGFAGIFLRLTYDTSKKAVLTNGGSLPSVTSVSPVGDLWSSSFHRRLKIQGNESIVASRGNGNSVMFNAGEAGTWVNVSDSGDSLVKSGSGYIYRDLDGGHFEIYGSNGELLSIALSGGGFLSFVNDSNGSPVSATDHKGRSFEFQYSSGLLNQVTSGGVVVFSISYDSAGRLEYVVWSDGSSRRFHYENQSFPWALTGVSDEIGKRYSIFGYDAYGRAVSTEYVGGGW